MLAFVSYPLSKDLTINLLSIVHMFVSNSTYPVIIQEEEAKLIVLCPNLFNLLGFPELVRAGKK